MLAAVLAAVPGAVTGEWDVLEPVERCDGRVPGLVDFLETHRWADRSLACPVPATAGIGGPRRLSTGPERWNVLGRSGVW